MVNTFLPPSMIVFINGDISYPPTPPIFIGSNPNNPHSYTGVSELTTLQTQLFIDDTITKSEFDARIVADANYPTIIHLQGLRVMVILPTFQDLVNRELADVVIFLHAGLVDVECNRLGASRQNFEVQRLTIYELLRAVCSDSVAIIPSWCCGDSGGKNCCDSCGTKFFCDRCHLFNGARICKKCDCGCKCGCDVGLIDNQGIRINPIFAANCENERNNHAFIHRK